MQEINTQPQGHLFVCCHQRDSSKSCCGRKNAESIVKELKQWTKDEGIHDIVKVSRSSCLGHCERGIAAVLYPQNKWFVDLSEKDCQSLKKLLKDL